MSNGEALFDTGEDVPQDLTRLLIATRRRLHMNPELGLMEKETSGLIREILEMHGLRVRGPLAGTGLYVDIVGALPGPRVGYRADIDALPIQDAKQVSYASQRPGIAHLCGHDVHTAIAIGIALLLNRWRARLHGTVRVFFQPNEEGIPSGAPLMIRDGVLEGVEAAYAVHVDPTLRVGVFGLADGAVTASADRFRIIVRGPSTGHSARPHQAVDTVWLSTLVMNALYQLVGRLTDARNSAVLAICRIHGGEAYNVIPASIEFGGTLRCIVNEDREPLRQHIATTASRIAALYGGKADVDFDVGSPSVYNDPRLVENVRHTLLDTLKEEAIFNIPLPSMGAEDFAHYLEHVPGALIRVGTASGPDTSHPLHDSSFDVDESALVPAATLMARVLCNHGTRRILS